MKRFYLLLLLLFFVSTQKIFADYHYKEVLSAQDQNLSIPPTIEGPGLFLPNSPLFFLDELKQSVRILFAVSDEEKARVHAAIAGERMAELRYMLAQKDNSAVRVDLTEIADNYKRAADDIEQARMAGHDVSLTAKEINDQLKSRQTVLADLGLSSVGEMRSLINAVSTSLFVSKIRIENGLKQADLENEVRDDLNWKAEMDLREASNSAAELKSSLEDIKTETDSTAQKSLTRREQAVQKAIDEKNEILRTAQQKLLDQEKINNDQTLKLQDSAIEQATQIVEKAKATALQFDQIKIKSPEEVSK